MGNLDFRQFRRAPSHRKPSMPGASDLAAMLRAGETIDDLATTFERSIGRVASILVDAGYHSRTGEPVESEDEGPPALGRLFAYPPWFNAALCAQTDLDLFFPEKGGSTREAKSVCARCTVAAECLDYALDNNERFGIWGGLSERERRSIRRRPQHPAGASMTSRTLTREETLTVLKHLATGKAHHVVATITRLNVKDVQGIADDHGHPDRDKLTDAIAQLEAAIDQAAAPPERPSTRTVPIEGEPTPRPRPVPDLRTTTKVGTTDDPFPRVDDEQTARLRTLINTAKGITDKRIQRQLERALDALTTLQTLVTKHQDGEAARARAEQEAAAARAEVQRLEKQLREAKAKLKGSAQRPGGLAAARSGQLDAVRGRGMVSTAELEALGVTSKQVRTWARESDVDCPDTGRLPSRVLDAWKAAHSDEVKAS